MYEIFDWHQYGRLFFALSVPLRTESVYILLITCILLLNVLIEIMLCFYCIFKSLIGTDMMCR